MKLLLILHLIKTFRSTSFTPCIIIDMFCMKIDTTDPSIVTNKIANLFFLISISDYYVSIIYVSVNFIMLSIVVNL